MTSIFIKEKRTHRVTHKEDGHAKTGRDVATIQGTLRITGIHQNLEEARKGSFLAFLEVAWLSRHLISDF